jgi:hypothetical protein
MLCAADERDLTTQAADGLRHLDAEPSAQYEQRRGMAFMPVGASDRSSWRCATALCVARRSGWGR